MAYFRKRRNPVRGKSRRPTYLRKRRPVYRKKTYVKKRKVFKKKVVRIVNNMSESKYFNTTNQWTLQDQLLVNGSHITDTTYDDSNQCAVLGFCQTDNNNGMIQNLLVNNKNMMILPESSGLNDGTQPPREVFIPLNLDRAWTGTQNDPTDGTNAQAFNPKNSIDGQYISPALQQCKFHIFVPSTSGRRVIPGSDPVAYFNNRSFTQPQLFRMIVFQIRGTLTGANMSDFRDREGFNKETIFSQLFLDNNGNPCGYFDKGSTEAPRNMTSATLQQQILNKRRFKIIQDKQFILQAPQFETGDTFGAITNAQTTVRYPCQKNITINFPKRKKAYYGSNPQAENLSAQGVYPLTNRTQTFVLFLQTCYGRSVSTIPMNPDQDWINGTAPAYITARPCGTFKDL